MNFLDLFTARASTLQGHALAMKVMSCYSDHTMKLAGSLFCFIVILTGASSEGELKSKVDEAIKSSNSSSDGHISL